jgi:hypothetical protein
VNNFEILEEIASNILVKNGLREEKKKEKCE